MSANIVRLYPSQHVSDTLRTIADQLDSGHLSCSNLTIATDEYDVFQLGSINDSEGAKDAVFNMTMALGKLQCAVYSEFEADE